MKLNLLANSVYKIEQMSKPTIKDKENLIKIKACGVCGSDIPRVFNNGAYHYPLVIGHEVSGVIEDSYCKEKIGKKVCVFPIKPCFNCENCKEENYANCEHYDYFGSRCDGGLQDYVVCDDFNIIELPNEISYNAAAMIEPCAVCLHAVKKANLHSKSVLKVYGAGTIGLLCCMIARALGVKNISIYDIDPMKMAFAEKLGFDTKTSNKPNVIIEASGSNTAIINSIKEIGAMGELILLGNTSNDIVLPIQTYSTILRKQITIKGAWNSSFKSKENDWKDVIEMIDKGLINPELLITHCYKLEDSDKALDMIKSRTEMFNKVMVNM